MDWYVINNIDELDTPALVVYPERVAANIRLAIKMAGDPLRLRPHVKTHKSPDVTRMMIDAGIHKFKCATIAEAEMLAMSGDVDVLFAYQPIGPKIRRFIRLIQQYPGSKFSCLIDNEDAARTLGAAFAGEGLSVPVYLDIDSGMHRTGMAPGEGALQLYRKAAELPGIIPVGLHVYDGHINDTDLYMRKQRCDGEFAAVEALREAIAGRLTLPAPVVVAGGSPTFPIHCGRKEVECSPGTFVYWDKGYSDELADEGFQPAALVITRVISLPGEDLICVDLGHKAVAAEKELTKRVRFINAHALKPMSHSEEHLVLKADTTHAHGVGDIFYGIPGHICPTVALHERAYTVEDGRVSGEWKNTARDRKISV